MAREFAKGFYASEAWRKCRLGYIRHRRSVDGGLVRNAMRILATSCTIVSA